jgi:hypothetical protein
MSTGNPFLHPAVFYRSEQEYLTAIVPFLRAGLNAGEPVAVAVPATHPVLIDLDGERPSPGYDPEQVLRTCNQPLDPPAPDSTSPSVPETPTRGQRPGEFANPVLPEPRGCAARLHDRAAQVLSRRWKKERYRWSATRSSSV